MIFTTAKENSSNSLFSIVVELERGLALARGRSQLVHVSQLRKFADIGRTGSHRTASQKTSQCCGRLPSGRQAADELDRCADVRPTNQHASAENGQWTVDVSTCPGRNRHRRRACADAPMTGVISRRHLSCSSLALGTLLVLYNHHRLC